MRLRPLYDRVLVEVESEMVQEHKAKNGIIGIAYENELDRSSIAQRWATVVGLPRAISDNFFVQGIQEELKVGDKILIHFNSIKESSRVDIDVTALNHQHIVFVQNIFAIFRGDEIIMYGGRVLCEPIYDEDTEILGRHGRVRKKGNIITAINVGHNLRKARLTHIGLPRLGQKKTDVEPGSIVFYEDDADFEHIINGKKYFVMVQDDIIMVE